MRIDRLRRLVPKGTITVVPLEPIKGVELQTLSAADLIISTQPRRFSPTRAGMAVCAGRDLPFVYRVREELEFVGYQLDAVLSALARAGVASLVEEQGPDGPSQEEPRG